jgi:SNF2 family DNA or RNA helicase
MAICTYNSKTKVFEIDNFASEEFYRSLSRQFTADGLLQSGGRLIVPWMRFVNKLDIISDFEDHYEEEIEYDSSAIQIIDKIKQSIIEFEHGNETSLPKLEAIPDILKKKGFKRELKQFQLENVYNLIKRSAGATFSVPGAGKTTEALAYYALTASADNLLLVISPINAFHAWTEELQGCYDNNDLEFVKIDVTGHMDVLKILSSGAKLFIVNYDKLDKIKNSLYDFLSENEVSVFLDESHYIKSISSLRTQAALFFADLPKTKLILTGTPLPNSLSDLVPQLNFLYPGMRAEEHDVVDKIRTIYVRTTRPQLEIPDGVFKPIAVPTSDSIRRIHRIFQNDIIRNINYESAAGVAQIKKNVMYLLQLISNPLLLLDKISEIPFFPAELMEDISAPKIDYVIKRARAIAKEKEKVVIWSLFRKNISTIHYHLQDIDCQLIMGGIDSESRSLAIDKFNNDSECNVIVINPAAGSEGISLHHNCHRAIYVDRSYNAVHWLQSQDRIRRIGQKYTPEFEILIHPNTIDERIETRLTAKVERMQLVLNDFSINVEKEPINFIDEDDADKYEDFGIDHEDIRQLVDSFKNG